MWCDDTFHFNRRLIFALAAGLVVSVNTVCAEPVASPAPVDITPCCDAGAGTCPPAQYEGARVALVLGTDSYPNFPAQFSRLKNARNDAVTLARVLKKQGFSVQCLLEPSKLLVTSEISLLRAHLTRMEATTQFSNANLPRALVYVGGHGAMLDGIEYVFFRTQPNQAVGNRYENARYSLEGIRSQFSGLDRFDLTMIVDACRSNIHQPAPGGPPVTTRSGDSPSFDGSSYANIGTQLFLAYSARRGGVAVDWMEGDAEAQKNGLFMSRLLRFIELQGIDQETMFTFTEAAVSNAGSLQNPGHAKEHHQRSGMSWIPTGSSQCSWMTDALWKQRSFCAFNDAAACKESICGTYAMIPETDTSTRACLANRNFLLGKPVAEFCAVATAAAPSLRQAFVTNSDPVTSPADLARIEALGVTSTFASATIDVRSPFTETAVTSPDRQARQDARSALLNLNANSMVLARIELPNEGLTVRNLPHMDAGRISTITPVSAPTPTGTPTAGKNPQIDCQAASCNKDWIGVRFGRGKTRTLGWVPAQMVKLAEPPKPRIEVQYQGKDFNLDDATIKEIRKQLAAIDLKKPMTVWLTAPQRHGREDSYLAEARLINAQTVIRRAGVAPDRIVSTLLTSDQQSANLPGLTIRIDGSPIAP